MNGTLMDGDQTQSETTEMAQNRPGSNSLSEPIIKVNQVDLTGKIKFTILIKKLRPKWPMEFGRIAARSTILGVELFTNSRRSLLRQ